MKYFQLGIHNLSKITLGTIQLGMNYGIANKSGKPDLSLSNAILAEAIANGINSFDTSLSYGESEKVLGKYFEVFTNKKELKITTKFKISKENISDKNRIVNEVIESAKRSLLHLKISRIPFYLFHQGPDDDMKIIMKFLPEIFTVLKKEGIIEMGGVSIYYPKDVDYIINEEEIKAVQVPINVLDQRLISSGNLTRLKQLDKIVFARSVFLQGLIFINPEEMPIKLYNGKVFLDKLIKISSDANISIQELAFRFVRDLDEISSLVIGAENVNQIHENISLMSRPTLPKEVSDRLRLTFQDVPELIITPGLWNL